MKLTIESTNKLTAIDGAPVRLCEGTTEAGVPVKVFVRMIAVRNTEDSSELERELAEQLPPQEDRVVSLRQIL